MALDIRKGVTSVKRVQVMGRSKDYIFKCIT